MARRRPRIRLSSILAETVLIVFAVLLALAVDQWWEERESRALARRTLDAVAGEMRSNRSRLLEGDAEAETASRLAALDRAIAAFREDRDEVSVAVNWDVVLLSAAAWETAQMNRSIQYMDLDRVIDLAEVYELQRFFLRNQDELASLIADVGSRMDADPVQALSQVRSRLAVTSSLRSTLATAYACRLVDLEGPDAVEPGACPADG